MVQSKALIVTQYPSLLKAVRQALAAGRARAEEAVERERVRTAWEIGRLIDRHILANKKRAGYDEQVIEKLARDLGKSRTEVYYMLEFARTYKIVPQAGQLSWSHYRALLGVNDAKERNVLARRAKKEKWARKRLRSEIKKITQKNKRASTVSLSTPLTAEPGTRGAYRIVRAEAGPYTGACVIDLGFSNYYKPTGTFRFRDQDIIIHVKNRLKKLKDGKEKDLFTYEAYVVQVTDGDTVDVVVDLGFGFLTAQKLRLRGINAPEMITKDGKTAQKALAKMLKNTSPILIRTIKSDKYDRYLADLFVNGEYVNGKLVEEGFAEVVGPR